MNIHLELSGHIFGDFFLALKKVIFLVAMPLPLPPLSLLVAGPLKQNFLRLP